MAAPWTAEKLGRLLYRLVALQAPKAPALAAVKEENLPSTARNEEKKNEKLTKGPKYGTAICVGIIAILLTVQSVTETPEVLYHRRLGDATIGALATVLGWTFWNYLREQPSPRCAARCDEER